MKKALKVNLKIVHGKVEKIEGKVDKIEGKIVCLQNQSATKDYLNAVKADLKIIKEDLKKFATKVDLKKYPNKVDLRFELEKYVTKVEFQETKMFFLEKFDYIINILDEIRTENAAFLQLHLRLEDSSDKQRFTLNDHENRIGILEKKN